MALSPGSRSGPCEVLAPEGAGGRGEVYRAADTRRAREVAIKLLLGFGDPQRLSPFRREARLLARMYHPNIVAIYAFRSGEVPERTLGFAQK